MSSYFHKESDTQKTYQELVQYIVSHPKNEHHILIDDTLLK